MMPRKVESYNFAGFGSIAMGASGRRHSRLFQDRLPAGALGKTRLQVERRARLSRTAQAIVHSSLPTFARQ